MSQSIWLQTGCSKLKQPSEPRYFISGPCLFCWSDCFMVLYMDDTLIFTLDDATIDTVIKMLSDTFQLEDQGSVNDFLGICAHDATSKCIHMTQPGLIESIIQYVGLSDLSNTKSTPSDNILHKDTSNSARDDTWNYRSVIGKLNYLVQNTCPDISFTVHQCTRFCTAPTKLHKIAVHKIAVKWIAQYLLWTKTRGLILKPTKTFTLDMFVDADFAGLWHKEHSSLHENILSCTGYVITFCGCPINWASKLQSKIALTTTESEYIALSTATRELLPLWCLPEEITNIGPIKTPIP